MKPEELKRYEWVTNKRTRKAITDAINKFDAALSRLKEPFEDWVFDDEICMNHEGEAHYECAFCDNSWPCAEHPEETNKLLASGCLCDGVEDMEAALDELRGDMIEFGQCIPDVTRAIAEFMRIGVIDRMNGEAMEKERVKRAAARKAAETRRKKQEVKERELLAELKRKYGDGEEVETKKGKVVTGNPRVVALLPAGKKSSG